MFSVVAVVVVTVSLTFEENSPISFQLLDDPRQTNKIKSYVYMAMVDLHVWTVSLPLTVYINFTSQFAADLPVDLLPMSELTGI